MTDLYELRDELFRVEQMSEREVCEAYNADSKKEVIHMIQEEINLLESEEFSVSDMDYTDEELEEERTNLCISQGLSRFC